MTGGSGGLGARLQPLIDPVTRRLVRVAQWVDRRWKYLDIKNRAWSDQEPAGWRKLLAGHSPALLLLSGVILAGLVHGPMVLPLRGARAFALTVACWCALVLGNAVFGRRGRVHAHRPWAKSVSWVLLLSWIGVAIFTYARGVHLTWTPLIAVLLGAAGCWIAPRSLGALWWFAVLSLSGAAAWWVLAEPGAREIDGGPFRHWLIPVGLATGFVALVFNRWWAWFLFEDRRDEYRAAFQPMLAQVQLFDPQIPAREKASDVLRAGFLALVSQPILVATVPAIAALVAPASSLLLWVVSVGFLWWLLIAMTVFNPRLDGLLDYLRRLSCEGAAAALSVFVILFAVCRLLGVDYVTTILDSTAGGVVTQSVFVLYGVAWFYDYWTSRALSDALLGLLHPAEDAPDAVVYDAERDRHSVPCRIVPLGGSRWAVIRYMGQGERLHFNIFSPLQVFGRLAAAADIQSAPRRLLPRLRTQIGFYRPLGTTLLAIVVWQAGAQVFERKRMFDLQPVAQVAAPSVSGEFPWEADRDGPPQLFVAASGGGTRAALYTYSALHALRERDCLDRLVVLSSVSGGGLPSAFLATWRADLLAATADAPIWNRFRDVVLHGYIDDVLRGASEWRLAAGYRLGQLLREGFHRKIAGAGAQPRSLAVSQVADLGVIYNTALVGEGPLHAPLAGINAERAGGRLVFTNLSSLERGARSPLFAEFPYEVVRRVEVELSAAAAASANFPPVFSNLPIDVPPDTTYWVVDGGAVDNRGLISLLFYLRQLPARVRARAHVAIVDVSGFSPEFQQTRGAQAALGAARQLANQVIAELYDDLTTDEEHAVRFYDLTLPKMLRISGSFGTHWRMQQSVVVTNPEPREGEPAEVELTAAEVVLAFARMFQPSAAASWLPESVDADRMKTLAQWLDRADEGPPTAEFDSLVEALAGR